MNRYLRVSVALISLGVLMALTSCSPSRPPEEPAASLERSVHVSVFDADGRHVLGVGGELAVDGFAPVLGTSDLPGRLSFALPHAVTPPAHAWLTVDTDEGYQAYHAYRYVTGSPELEPAILGRPPPTPELPPVPLPVPTPSPIPLAPADLPSPPTPAPPILIGGLPQSTHPIDTAYMLDDSLYGNVRGRGASTSSLLVWSYYGPEPKAPWIVSSLQDAIARRPRALIFGPDVNPSDGIVTAAAIASLHAAAPFWSSIDVVYFDELGHDDLGLDAYIDTWNSHVRAAGLQPKPVWINFTRQQVLGGRGWRASRLACAGVEAYADPAWQKRPDVTTVLRADLEQQLGLVETVHGCTFLVGQSYDHNGLWTNIPALVALQTVPYDVIWNRSSVKALWWFSLERPGGALDHPVLIKEHQRVINAIR